MSASSPGVRPRSTGAPPRSETRRLAPFGLRTRTVTGRDAVGAYVVVRCADPDGPRPQPGQFYMLRAAERWGGGEDERPFLGRAFSVLRAPTGELHFLLEDVGPGTNRLCELGPGDGLAVLGPLGHGFDPPAEGRRPVLVGGGVGIAPLAILQDELAEPVTVLLGFRDGAHARGAQLLRDAKVATDDGSVGYHGLVTDLLRHEPDDVEVYACGPEPMLAAVRDICASRGLPAQVALEAPMGCGYGACFGCAVPTRRGLVRLCLEGPVLRTSDWVP